jgi:hypothetical protein
MVKGARSLAERLRDDVVVKPRKPVPHAFVLEALDVLSPRTRPMFGCVAVYIGQKIVLLLRDKAKAPEDNGVWLATIPEHHESLRGEFPNMRSIRLLGKPVTGWQLLAVDAPDFEAAALRACELIVLGDPRIGKIPTQSRTRPSTPSRTKASRRVQPGSAAATRRSRGTH